MNIKIFITLFLTCYTLIKLSAQTSGEDEFKLPLYKKLDVTSQSKNGGFIINIGYSIWNYKDVGDDPSDISTKSQAFNFGIGYRIPLNDNELYFEPILNFKSTGLDKNDDGEVPNTNNSFLYIPLNIVASKNQNTEFFIGPSIYLPISTGTWYSEWGTLKTFFAIQGGVNYKFSENLKLGFGYDLGLTPYFESNSGETKFVGNNLSISFNVKL